MQANGYVTVKIETFDANTNRTNIECFSISQESFLNMLSPEWRINMQQACERTKKEILNPTPKTPMA